ncbi:hypothetical protein OPV22_024113 [Ensete ventricosum]|uniref:Ubiquitin carboxyl-terminal hydrolase n=2 Tax=Ensete ventricosum TaxID=4639 RepID=A0AAV8QNS1_ENSVE|nr:hypothetical protein OPV22_024113 [Ensete ventricosum]
MGNSPAKASSSSDPSTSTPDFDNRVYLVPYRWWKGVMESEAEEDRPSGIPYSISPVAPRLWREILRDNSRSDFVCNIERDDHWKEDGDAAEGASSLTYALIPFYSWFMVLDWRFVPCFTSKKYQGFSSIKAPMVDVYPLMLRVSVTQKKILTVKISKKDNSDENFKRSSNIFSSDFKPVHVLDFTGKQTDEWDKWLHDCFQQPDHEILLCVRVSTSENMSSGLHFFPKMKDLKDTMSLPQSKITSFSNDDPHTCSEENIDNPVVESGDIDVVGPLGLTGLKNLGNTCFMNSAIQCLAHTPKLVDYFLGDYSRDINLNNPLGTKGELASLFADLLRRLWTLDRTPVDPCIFKENLGRFASEYAGRNQHDSHEFLAFLLDGLHEDLNRVKFKSCFETKDSSGDPDEVAAEYWANHLSRNDSIIVDTCQGLYKSTLVCHVCNIVSMTFDPFIDLSLPLPSTNMRRMTITVFSTNGTKEPSTFTINVPKFGKVKHIIQALSTACSLRDDETLLIAEVFANHIISFLEEPLLSISFIRNDDHLAAYQLPKDFKNGSLMVFAHQRMGETHLSDQSTSSWKGFGTPLIAELPSKVEGNTIRSLFLKLLNPFKRSNTCSINKQDKSSNNFSDTVTKLEARFHVPGHKNMAEGIDIEDALQFFLTDKKGSTMGSQIQMDEIVSPIRLKKKLYVIVRWNNKALEDYYIGLLNTLPVVCQQYSKGYQEYITLYACLEAFLTEESLTQEDTWYCPCCKKHQQAVKKLDLWRLPEVMVIHLMRFSYSQHKENKLETFVDYPVDDLDMSPYVSSGGTDKASYHYRLYAISNHYGSLGGGHYTAYVYDEGVDGWFKFDDENVVYIDEVDDVKTSAAYLLFYRRV